jgi:pyruvate formate lyase activating enzyme
MHIKGWVRSSLLDYPGRIAASLFCGGCNFRCPHCHNADLVLHPDQQPDLPPDQIWDFLSRRHGLLDGVAISGGEPTLQPDLLDFAGRVREMGFLVKLDTNGYRPQVLEAMLDAGLLDYVAMDIKAPLKKYDQAAGVSVDIERIERSMALLRNSPVEYEFRTTVVPGLLAEEDIIEIARLVSGVPRFCLQQFVPHNTLDPDMTKQVPYLPERVRAMVDLVAPSVGEVWLRGL